MDVGTGLFTCQRRPDDDRPTSDIYDEMLTLARAAEDADLASVWVSEHHFAEDGYLSGTMPALGALAAATDRIEVGSCVALAPLYDPVRLAEDAATVSLLADGRLTLGLAIGSNPREFAEFGVPTEERADRLEDALPVLRGAWSPGALDYDPAYHPVSPATTVTPKPDAGDVPVMLGGAAKPAVRRAARTADAWCAPSKLSVEGIRKRVADIRQVREEAGLDGPFDVYLLQHGFLGDSRADAWEAMREGYLYLQRRYAEIFSGERVEELSPERVEELRSQAIFGEPETVAAELERYDAALADEVDALGGDLQFVFRTYHPGIGTDRMVECVERLGDEVASSV